jgi:hypothetical protein
MSKKCLTFSEIKFSIIYNPAGKGTWAVKFTKSGTTSELPLRKEKKKGGKLLF